MSISLLKNNINTNNTENFFLQSQKKDFISSKEIVLGSAYTQKEQSFSKNSLSIHKISSNTNVNTKLTWVDRTSKTAAKIGLFIQQNWKIFLLYILIWTIIIVCYGAIYGFETVGFPLAIGLGVGFGIGVIVGIIVALKIDKKNKWCGKNTLWNLITHYMWNLDEYGTRQILVATIITVISAALIASPYAVGAVIGLLLGNHILTKICYNLREISSPLSFEQKQLIKKEKQEEIEKIKNQLKIEFLIKNQILLKKRILNMHSKTSDQKILIKPTNKISKQKRSKLKRILTNKKTLTYTQTRKILTIQNAMKQNSSQIKLLCSKLLQLDHTIDISLIESAFKI